MGRFGTEVELTWILSRSLGLLGGPLSLALAFFCCSVGGSEQMCCPSRQEGFNVIDPYIYRAPNQELAQQQMLLVMGIMASNPDKKDDAIDGALLRAWDKMKQEQGDGPAKMKEGYEQLDLTGFNPEVKRTRARKPHETLAAKALKMLKPSRLFFLRNSTLYSFYGVQSAKATGGDRR